MQQSLIILDLCWTKIQSGKSHNYSDHFISNNTQHVAARHNRVAKRVQHVVPNKSRHFQIPLV